MTKRAAPELVLSCMDELIAEDTVKRFCSILEKIRLEKETKDKDSKMDGLEWRCRQVGPLKLRFFRVPVADKRIKATIHSSTVDAYHGTFQLNEYGSMFT